MKSSNPNLTWPVSKRLGIYSKILVSIYLVIWCYWSLTGAGLLDRKGAPIGSDFSHYWVASSLALQGEATSVFNPDRLLAAEKEVFGFGYLVWLYPPTFLLMVLPLALLPYLCSLAVWLSVTLAGYLKVLRRIAPQGLTVWLTLAFPGTFINIIYGQNGFLSGIFLGGGLVLVDRFPVSGGALLGLLTFKPHLAVLPGVALVAGRRWRALAAMAISAICLVAASILAFGTQVWTAFFRNIPIAIQILETGQNTGVFPFFKVPSLFSAVYLAGAGIMAARTFQALAMAGAATVVAWAWYRELRFSLRASILVLSILIFTPYIGIFDLALLALPIAWLGWEGLTHGWMPGEIPCLVLGWLLPILSPPLANGTNIQIAPLVLMTLIFLTVRRRNIN